MVNYRLEINHPWPDSSLTGTFFLVATNFILLVAIFICVRLREWGTAGFLTTLMFVSSMYHACRGGLVCFMRFRDAQVADHLAVNAVLIWVAAKCAVKREWFASRTLLRTPEIVMEAAVMVFAIMFFVVACFVLNNPESVWANVFGFGVGVTFVTFSSVFTNSPIFYNHWFGWAGVALFGVSVIFYSLCPKDWYEVAHSVWHLLSMTAIPLIVIACWHGWVIMDEQQRQHKNEQAEEVVINTQNDMPYQKIQLTTPTEKTTFIAPNFFHLVFKNENRKLLDTYNETPLHES